VTSGLGEERGENQSDEEQMEILGFVLRINLKDAVRNGGV